MYRGTAGAGGPCIASKVVGRGVPGMQQTANSFQKAKRMAREFRPAPASNLSCRMFLRVLSMSACMAADSSVNGPAGLLHLQAGLGGWRHSSVRVARR